MANRVTGIELLRGLLMLMVVLVHLTGNGVLKSEAPIAYTEPNWLWANLIDAICYPAVNTFVLISGYFGIKLSLGRVLKLDVPVIFYCFGLYMVFGTFTWGGAISSFMPILTDKYWFLTVYFLLMLTSPFLNAFIDNRNQCQLKILLLLATLLFVIVPSFSPFRLSETRGMDVVNFCVLYIVGRVIALLKIDLSTLRSLLLYTISTVVVFLLTVLWAYKFGINNGWKSLFYAYNNIFVYLQAIGLFFLFKPININGKVDKVINWLAPSFFFVYIIHSHPAVHKKLYLWISSSDFYFSNMFFFHTIGWGLVIFLSCIIIDIVLRRFLFNPMINATIYFLQMMCNVIHVKCTSDRI